MKTNLDLVDNFPCMTNSLFWGMNTEFIPVLNHPTALQHHICHKKNEISIFVFAIVTSWRSQKSGHCPTKLSQNSFNLNTILFGLPRWQYPNKKGKIILTKNSIFYPRTTKHVCFTTQHTPLQTANLFSPRLLHTGECASFTVRQGILKSWPQSSTESHRDGQQSLHMLMLKQNKTNN